MFLTAMKDFGCNALKCVSMNNQECRNKNRNKCYSDEPSFYPYSAEVDKYSGSCNKINNP